MGGGGGGGGAVEKGEEGRGEGEWKGISVVEIQAVVSHSLGTIHWLSLLN